MINLLVIDPQAVIKYRFKNFLSDFHFLDAVCAAEDDGEAVE